MQSCRSAMASGLDHISRHVSALEDAISREPGLAFDLSKVLVESVCKKLLMDIGIPFTDDDDLPKLYKIVTMNVPLLPTSASSEAAARESVKRALGGLTSTLVGICELRNAYGFASHGSAAERSAMESTEATLVAQSADAIVGFLYSNHMRDRSPAVGTVIGYGDNPEFNQYADNENGIIQIFDLQYQPSEVLFYVDRSAYDDQLTGFNSAVLENMQLGVAEEERESEF